MATSLKALKEKLPVPGLVEWFLQHPEHVENMAEMHSEETTNGKCTQCLETAPCKYSNWAEEASEYLAALKLRHDMEYKYVKRNGIR